MNFFKWLAYLPTYIYIQSNRQRRAHFKNDEGMKYMRRYTTMVIFILAVILIILNAIPTK